MEALFLCLFHLPEQVLNGIDGVPAKLNFHGLSRFGRRDLYFSQEVKVLNLSHPDIKQFAGLKTGIKSQGKQSQIAGIVSEEIFYSPDFLHISDRFHLGCAPFGGMVKVFSLFHLKTP
jgi:hypothetical protein